MLKLIPKVTEAVMALRLRNEIMAEKGDWLIIHPNDRVEVVAEAKMREHYNLPKPEPKNTRYGHKKTWTRYTVQLEKGYVYIPGQLAQILLAVADNRLDQMPSSIRHSQGALLRRATEKKFILWNGEVAELTPTGQLVVEQLRKEIQ